MLRQDVFFGKKPAGARRPGMTYLETWKQIATQLHRSERWCRNMAQREIAPLPVYRVGGVVRLDLADLEAWLGQERERTIARPVAPALAPAPFAMLT
ncbi:MAG: hypothetical protein K8M05_10590 [Deltaproteobacteria bacterium]|nr:hypothetical protein [Kofleriaceae bacterium]